MTFRLFLEALAAVGGLAGLAFLYIYFRKGLPGKALLPRPVRVLITIALVSDSVAAVVYAVLVMVRLAMFGAPVATSFWDQVISTFILGAAILPAVAILAVALYVHYRPRGDHQGWVNNGRDS